MDGASIAPGQKRKSDRDRDAVSFKSAPPAKKAAVAAPASKSSTVKKEGGAKATASQGSGSGSGAGASGVKESKSDTSFFSKPKPKLPTFKKAPIVPVKKEDTANVAQPSSVNPFQEALNAIEKSRRQSPIVVPPPAQPSAATPDAAGAAGPTNLSKSGMPKKKVTWAPDGRLELVKLIERAVYDDDPVAVSALFSWSVYYTLIQCLSVCQGAHSVHSNLRDLDKGEGAALHHAADTFEELIDWIEPSSEFQCPSYRSVMTMTKFTSSSRDS
jgi:protein phosphatase 1 regulatory subunit 10